MQGEDDQHLDLAWSIVISSAGQKPVKLNACPAGVAPSRLKPGNLEARLGKTYPKKNCAAPTENVLVTAGVVPTRTYHACAKLSVANCLRIPKNILCLAPSRACKTSAGWRATNPARAGQPGIIEYSAWITLLIHRVDDENMNRAPGIVDFGL